MRAHLFRWWKRTQLDVSCRGGWLSLGLDRRSGWRPIAYWSPDATPVHPRAKGLRCAEPRAAKQQRRKLLSLQLSFRVKKRRKH